MKKYFFWVLIIGFTILLPEILKGDCYFDGPPEFAIFDEGESRDYFDNLIHPSGLRVSLDPVLSYNNHMNYGDIRKCG